MDFRDIFWNLFIRVQNIQVWLNSGRQCHTVYNGCLCIFMIISQNFSRMETFQVQVVEKMKTDFVQNLSAKSCRLQDNYEKCGRARRFVWRWKLIWLKRARVACWVIKSKVNKLIVFVTYLISTGWDFEVEMNVTWRISSKKYIETSERTEGIKYYDCVYT
jgi:hypothetical protein